MSASGNALGSYSRGTWAESRTRYLLSATEFWWLSLVSEEEHCHLSEWLSTGFGLVTGFIDHVQMVTTSNYNALANPCTFFLTAAYTKSSQFHQPFPGNRS
jgi:hypothetical protein